MTDGTYLLRVNTTMHDTILGALELHASQEYVTALCLVLLVGGCAIVRGAEGEWLGGASDWLLGFNRGVSAHLLELTSTLQE